MVGFTWATHPCRDSRAVRPTARDLGGNLDTRELIRNHRGRRKQMTPRKRVLALAFLSGVVAVSVALAGRSHTVATVALAASGDKTPAGTTIHLLEDEGPSISVPNGRHAGLAAGDEAVFTRTLRTVQKKPVG